MKKINIAGKICFQEPMSRHTSFRIGGPAELFIEPVDAAELIKIRKFCQAEAIPCFILGAGANILVADAGIRGVVLSLRQLAGLTFQEHRVMAGAGCDISTVAEAAVERRLGGLEFLYAMPGSVGGAVYMNARCYGSSLGDILHRVTVLDSTNQVRQRLSGPDDFGYKTSPFQTSGEIILEAEFKLTPASRAVLRTTMQEIKQDRIAKGHFLAPCAGSVFKNNRSFGRPSGAIIDSLGLKGYSIGQAGISAQHANIIINTGSARAADVYALMQFIMRKVQDACGYELEPEIILAGEWKESL